MITVILDPANSLMHKISKVTMRTAGPRAQFRVSRTETRTQNPPDGMDRQLSLVPIPGSEPPPPAREQPTELPPGSVLLSQQKFPSFRRRERRCKVFSQTSGHTTANAVALGYPQARARWSVLPAALSVTV